MGRGVSHGRGEAGTQDHEHPAQGDPLHHQPRQNARRPSGERQLRARGRRPPHTRRRHDTRPGSHTWRQRAGHAQGLPRHPKLQPQRRDHTRTGARTGRAPGRGDHRRRIPLRRRHTHRQGPPAQPHHHLRGQRRHPQEDGPAQGRHRPMARDQRHHVPRTRPERPARSARHTHAPSRQGRRQTRHEHGRTARHGQGPRSQGHDPHAREPDRSHQQGLGGPQTPARRTRRGPGHTRQARDLHMAANRLPHPRRQARRRLRHDQHHGAHRPRGGHAHHLQQSAHRPQGPDRRHRRGMATRQQTTAQDRHPT